MDTQPPTKPASDLAKALSEGGFGFGPFELRTPERILFADGKQLRLGSRAIDILLVLVERAGELVSKEDLNARVWPNTFVEEANIRVHIAALRKVLGEGQGVSRYIATVAGRGYCFVAPVRRLQKPGAPQEERAAERKHNLPAPLTRLIGRGEVVSTLTARLPQRRFITIVGPGGLGKTTVAVAVAEGLLSSAALDACFLDLGCDACPKRPWLCPRAIHFVG